MDKTSYRVLTLTVSCMLLLSTTAQQVIAWPCPPCPPCYTCTPTGCEPYGDCWGGCPSCESCVSCYCQCTSECCEHADCQSCYKCENCECVPDGCAGVTAGSINRDKEWAHYDRANPSNSTTITLTAVGGSDPDFDGSSCSGNYIDLDATEWNPSSGECDPPTGNPTSWKPSARGLFSVTATFNDYTTPCDEPGDESDSVAINAFEVKVYIEVVDNAGGGNGTENVTVWEYDTLPGLVSWTDLPCSAEANDWQNTSTSDIIDDDSVFIEWTFRAVPDTADLSGGTIRAKLRTYSTVTEHVDIDDYDIWDGSISNLTLSVTIGAPVGFTCSWTPNFGSDCSEATAVAAWGYSSCEGGVGNDKNPEDYHLKKNSEAEGDGGEPSSFCVDMLSPPSLDKMVHHRYDLNQSYDTGYVTRSKPNNGQIQSEWTGYVNAETGGNKYGKYAKAELQDWGVWAGVKDVEYVP